MQFMLANYRLLFLTISPPRCRMLTPFEINQLFSLQQTGQVALPAEYETVDIPLYKPFDIDQLAPAVRQACEDHLNTIFEVDADSRVYVDQLTYLAWLWANGFVFYDERDGMHWVDGRYEFDNGWFDNNIIDNIYSEYELDKLVPLLREAGSDAGNHS